MTSPQFIPAAERFGGSRVGNSYLNEWAGCRRKWFFRYAFPDLAQFGGVTVPADVPLLGIAPYHTDPNLLKGSAFHEGLLAIFSTSAARFARNSRCKSSSLRAL